MRRTLSRHVDRSVITGATTPNRNGLVMSELRFPHVRHCLDVDRIRRLSPYVYNEHEEPATTTRHRRPTHRPAALQQVTGLTPLLPARLSSRVLPQGRPGCGWSAANSHGPGISNTRNGLRRQASEWA